MAETNQFIAIIGSMETEIRRGTDIIDSELNFS